MSSASKWEPCKLLSVACSLALLLCTVRCLSLGLVLALWQTHHSHLLARGRTLSHTLSVCNACPSMRTHSRTHVTDGGGYDPKRRSAPAQSGVASAQSYTAPTQSAPAAVAITATVPTTTVPTATEPMPIAPASKWQPCTLSFPRCVCMSLSHPLSFPPPLSVCVHFPVLVFSRKNTCKHRKTHVWRYANLVPKSVFSYLSMFLHTHT